MAAYATAQVLPPEVAAARIAAQPAAPVNLHVPAAAAAAAVEPKVSRHGQPRMSLAHLHVS